MPLANVYLTKQSNADMSLRAAARCPPAVPLLPPALAPGALNAPEFELGVSCPRCFHVSTSAQKDGARERQRQWLRAKARAKAQN